MDQPGTLVDDLHERDFHAWTQNRAAKLRARSHSDIEPVAEEIESLGRSDKREIGNRIGVIPLHLLKHQPSQRKPGLLLALGERRDQVSGLLLESASLKSLPAEAVQQEFAFARRKAAVETELPLTTFSEEPAYSVEDVLSLGFFPGVPWTREGIYRD